MRFNLPPSQPMQCSLWNAHLTGSQSFQQFYILLLVCIFILAYHHTIMEDIMNKNPFRSLSSTTTTNTAGQCSLFQCLMLYLYSECIYLFFLVCISFLVSSYVVLSCLLWLNHNTTLQLFLLQLHLLMVWKHRSMCLTCTKIRKTKCWDIFCKKKTK